MAEEEKDLVKLAKQVKDIEGNVNFFGAVAVIALILSAISLYGLLAKPSPTLTDILATENKTLRCVEKEVVGQTPGYCQEMLICDNYTEKEAFVLTEKIGGPGSGPTTDKVCTDYHRERVCIPGKPVKECVRWGIVSKKPEKEVSLKTYTRGGQEFSFDT